ncbi:MAG TPA: hypothetical protein VGF82_14545 [Terracidiphilus sp.]|jgi:hypothetical protein
MLVRSSNLALCVLAILSVSVTAPADDLHFKKSISVGGNTVSTSETWVKGARQRTVTASPAGNLVTLRQCDLKRTVTLNEPNQSYLVTKDSEDESVSQAAALMASGPSTTSGGSITQTVTVTDTGERKQMSGYAARHLRTRVVVESSADACSKTNQSYEIDGWYADITKEPLSCSQGLPPVKQTANCADRIIVRHKGTGKPGYPLHETITLQNDGGTPTKIEVATSEISKDAAQAELFDIPAAYHEVHSESELYVAALPPGAAPTASQSPASYGSGVPNSQQMVAQALPGGMNPRGGMTSPLSMMQAMSGKASGAAMMQGAPSGAPVPPPQVLGPKAPGRIRIGIAPAQAQMGQGSTSQEDYGAPVRNAIVLMMSGPAIEIAALESRIPIQLQAEAQQKECDYVLLSNVTVKRNASTGFGKFMKAGSMAANFTPMGMMAHSMGSMGSMVAAQAASSAMQTAAMSSQQQAMSQLSGFNGQIKSKDEVTVEYQLLPTGQSQPKLDNTLKGKSKSDGEDVLTPLIQQAATTILTEVSKK